MGSLALSLCRQQDLYNLVQGKQGSGSQVIRIKVDMAKEECKEQNSVCCVFSQEFCGHQWAHWTHEGWTLVQQLDLHDKGTSSPHPFSPCCLRVGQDLTLCIHLDSFSSDLLLQKCWVQWKLLCITLKNRDIGGKPIKHLLNQVQITRFCGPFFLISVKTKPKLHKTGK